jgi:carboxyl-terminal processing protease
MNYKVLSFIRRKFLLFSLVLVVIVLAAGASSRYFEISKHLDIYATLFKEVNEFYVEEVNVPLLMREGIDAMLKSLDPYTTFISEAEIEDFRFMTTGHYGGIGASVSRRGDYVMISEVYEGFPAHKSGLIPGDRFVEINGNSVIGKSTSEVSEILKGQPGTEAIVYIKREGHEDLLEFSVERQQVQIDNVPFYGLIDEKTGYIRLNSFKQGATREVRSALLELREEHDITALVLDLRNNPGGLLNEAISMVNLFVPRGELIVSTKGRVEEWKNDYRTRNEPVDTEMPVITLINDRSASASEIVAGALQDLDRGVVIGQTSFGKGSVQTTRSLSYNTQLKITTAKYYIPSGRSIQRIDDAVEDKSIVQIDEDRPTEFQTRNGRVVHESNGIEPDVKTERLTDMPVIQRLRREHLFFDFATHFHHTHDDIAAPADFEIDDEIFAGFLEFVKSKDFTFNTAIAREFDDFALKAQDEEVFDAIAENIKTIREKLTTNVEAEILRQEDGIRKILTEEIVSRYYHRAGRIESSFRRDPEVLKASEVLRDISIYDNILTSAE